MRWFTCALAAMWPALGLAGPSADVVLDTFETWGQRSLDELEIDGVRPYRATFAASDVWSYTAHATFGALTSETDSRTRPGRVEVVVGSDALSSRRYRKDRRARDTVVGRPSFVVDDHGLAISRDLWLGTDSSFKAALKQLQLKTTNLAQLASDFPPDWNPSPPVVQDAHVDAGPVDSALLRRIALEASAALRDIDGLRTGTVEVYGYDGRYMLSTTEGTRLVQPIGYVSVYGWADVLRDGVEIWDSRQWVVHTTDDLPPVDEIVAAIRAVGERVAARAAAADVAYYEGPVVFEGEAAADFFRYLATPELEGTPPVAEGGRTYEQLTRDGPRIGRRLLPARWAVVDDPGTDLPGHFAFDREGVSGQPVTLVEDGYVRDLLRTQVPRDDGAASNGHARGSLQGTWSARMSTWEVRPGRSLSDRAFDRRVGDAVRASGMDRVLVIHRLARGRTKGLPKPMHAVWRHADGTETPVSSLQFQNEDRRALRDVIAAGGGAFRRSYLAPSSTGTAPRIRGLPTTITAPKRVLVAEMELVFPGATEQPHVLGMSPL